MVFLFYFSIIIIIFLIIIATSGFKIKSIRLEKNTVKVIYNIKIIIYIFNIIPIYIKNINSNKKIRKKYYDKAYKKYNKKKQELFKKFIHYKNKSSLIKYFFQMIKNFEYTISGINLKLFLGTKNYILNSYLVALISSICSLLCVKNMQIFPNFKYEVLPYYQKNDLMFFINFEGNIDIKLVSIVVLILNLNKINSKVLD